METLWKAGPASLCACMCNLWPLACAMKLIVFLIADIDFLTADLLIDPFTLLIPRHKHTHTQLTSERRMELVNA